MIPSSCSLRTFAAAAKPCHHAAAVARDHCARLTAQRQARRPVAGGLVPGHPRHRYRRRRGLLRRRVSVCASTRPRGPRRASSAASASASSSRPRGPGEGRRRRRRRELTASSLPDEDAEKTETLWDVAALDDPQSRRVWAGFAAGKDAPAPAQPAAKVVLKVKDLPAAIEFYTTGLGMTLLRQRALVPDGPPSRPTSASPTTTRAPESGASGAARLESAALRRGRRVRPTPRSTSWATRRRARSAPASRRHGRQPGGRAAHGPGRPRGRVAADASLL